METLRMQLEHRGLFTFFCLSLVLLFLGGCSVALDKSIVRPQASVPESNRLTVAVLPFEHVRAQVEPEEGRSRSKAEKAKQEGNSQMEKFERNYFPASLVETLRQSPWVKQAYVAPAMTPTVDFIVRGSVTESDGEVTVISITLARCCWKDALTQTFRADLASSDFKEATDPSDMFWYSVVNALGRHFDTVSAEDRSKIVKERAAAYLEQTDKNVSLTNRGIEIVQGAARWENENVLGRVSDMALTFTKEAKPKYIEWQKEATRLAEKKRDQNLKAGFSAALTVANFGLGMYAASQGFSGIAFTLAGGAGSSIVDLMASAKESASLGAAMKDMTNVFSVDLEPSSIKVGDRVYKLTGDAREQMKEARQILLAQIRAELVK